MFSRWPRKLHWAVYRLGSDWKRSCYSLFEDHAHGLRFLGRHNARKKVERLLASGAIEIDFTNYIESGILDRGCPIRKIYVNQLAANSPLEDRWNVGFTQVDGVISSCLFTVLDGHSGTMCAHTLAWSLLDYVAASFLDTEKLVLALNHWRTHGLDQPYHLARRLDLLASTDHRRLGHAASAPAPQLSAHIRLCLQDYVKDLVERIDRNMDPEQCMIEAMLRMDDVLCSTHYEIDLHGEPPPPSPSALPQDLTLARELLRVALSGAVGITGRLFWQQTEDSHSAQLHLANVGDCGAVLLRLVNPSDEYCEEPLLEAVSCSRPHQGACNSDEIARVVQEHPENNPSDLFREGGRLLGELAPSRAFGNVRYKWPAKRVLELSKVLDRLYSSTSDNGTVSHPGSGIIGAGSGSLRRDAAAAASSLFPMPAPYTSPPYLTAKPDVTHFEITPAYRYLVLGTDGLWDLLSSREVALIMQEELRKSGSPATRLLWNCLTSIPPSMARVIAQDSSNDSQPPVAKPSIERADSKAFSRALKLLSLPPGLARYYRDDITVMVIELAAGR